jgi:hypothetical protein
MLDTFQNQHFFFIINQPPVASSLLQMWLRAARLHNVVCLFCNLPGVAFSLSSAFH